MPGIREEGRRHPGLRSRHSPTSISECSQPACEVFLSTMIWTMGALWNWRANIPTLCFCVTSSVLYFQEHQFITNLTIWPTSKSIKSIAISYFNYHIKLIKLVVRLVRCPSDHIRASPKLHQCPLDYSFGSWESYMANLLLRQSFEWYNHANIKTKRHIGLCTKAFIKCKHLILCLPFFVAP